MFNRQPFNRKTTAGSAITGVASMKMGALAISSKIISASGISSMKMSGAITPTNNKYSSGISSMKMGGTGNGTKVLFGVGDAANMVMQGTVIKSISGEAFINLLGITLKPGDELIINTTDMTITLNGENAMEYFSSDSDFFNLLTGSNEIVYNDANTSRTASVNATWKDRWL